MSNLNFRQGFEGAEKVNTFFPAGGLPHLGGCLTRTFSQNPQNAGMLHVLGCIT